MKIGNYGQELTCLEVITKSYNFIVELDNIIFNDYKKYKH